jgi:hypothetical protein
VASNRFMLKVNDVLEIDYTGVFYSSAAFTKVYFGGSEGSWARKSPVWFDDMRIAYTDVERPWVAFRLRAW